MLANINNDALKITLLSHQNLAGNIALVSLVPLVQIIQHTQKIKPMKSKAFELHYAWSIILQRVKAWVIFVLH